MTGAAPDAPGGPTASPPTRLDVWQNISLADAQRTSPRAAPELPGQRSASFSNLAALNPLRSESWDAAARAPAPPAADAAGRPEGPPAIVPPLPVSNAHCDADVHRPLPPMPPPGLARGRAHTVSFDHAIAMPSLRAMSRSVGPSARGPQRAGSMESGLNAYGGSGRGGRPGITRPSLNAATMAEVRMRFKEVQGAAKTAISSVTQSTDLPSRGVIKAIKARGVMESKRLGLDDSKLLIEHLPAKYGCPPLLRTPWEATQEAPRVVTLNVGKLFALVIAIARTLLNCYFITVNWLHAAADLPMIPPDTHADICPERATADLEAQPGRLPDFWTRLMRFLTWAELILLYVHIFRCFYSGWLRARTEHGGGWLGKIKYAMSAALAHAVFSTPRVVLFRSMELVNIQNIGQVLALWELLMGIANDVAIDLLSKIRFYVGKSFAAAVNFWRERSFLAFQTMVTKSTIQALSNPGAPPADDVAGGPGGAATPTSVAGTPATLLDRANSRVHSWWLASGNAGLSTPTHHGFHPHRLVARSPFAARGDRRSSSDARATPRPSDAAARPSSAAAWPFERPSGADAAAAAPRRGAPGASPRSSAAAAAAPERESDDGRTLLSPQHPRSDARGFHLLQPEMDGLASPLPRPASERFVRGFVTVLLFAICVTLTLLMAAVVLAITSIWLACILLSYTIAVTGCLVPLMLLLLGVLAFLQKVATADFVRYKFPLCWDRRELLTVFGFISQVVVLHRPQLERAQAVWDFYLNHQRLRLVFVSEGVEGGEDDGAPELFPPDSPEASHSGDSHSPDLPRASAAAFYARERPSISPFPSDSARPSVGALPRAASASAAADLLSLRPLDLHFVGADADGADADGADDPTAGGGGAGGAPSAFASSPPAAAAWAPTSDDSSSSAKIDAAPRCAPSELELEQDSGSPSSSELLALERAPSHAGLRVPELADVEELVAGGFGVRQNDVFCAMRLLIITTMVERQRMPHFVAEYVWLILNFTEVDHLLKPFAVREGGSRGGSMHARSKQQSAAQSAASSMRLGSAPPAALG